MAASWFPTGRNDERGWRLDIVSLLAVIGESSMEEHAQVLTSSWIGMLPRIIPAPQALLKPMRPTRLPQVNASVVGVHNGTSIPSLNYFPNIIHPIEDLPALSFKVLEIKHKSGRNVTPGSTSNEKVAATSVDLRSVENGHGPSQIRKRSTFRAIGERFVRRPTEQPRTYIPSRRFSPLNILSVLSCLLTIGILVWAALIKDGTAVTAIGTISLATSVVGYASWWSPVLTQRTSHATVPPGDVVIRTREGAFLLVRCDENVARELYTGTEECRYYVEKTPYRLLVGFGTFLLMISVVLLGNCHFAMQAAIGVSYIVLNGAFWGASLLNKKRFWISPRMNAQMSRLKTEAERMRHKTKRFRGGQALPALCGMPFARRKKLAGCAAVVPHRIHSNGMTGSPRPKGMLKMECASGTLWR